MRRLICIMAAALALSSPAPASAELDMFLKLDEIRGESTDVRHKDWIDVLSFSWGVTNAVIGTGGGSSSKPVFAPFSFTQLLDSSVPETFAALASGKRIARMTFDLSKPGDKRGTFFQMEFEDVHITSMSTSGHAGSAVPEVALKTTYEKITMRYTPQDSKGGAGKPVVAVWDLKANTKLAGDSAALIGLFEAGGSFDNGDLSLVSAVPEPGSYAMMLAGLGLVLVAARGRLGRR